MCVCVARARGIYYGPETAVTSSYTNNLGAALYSGCKRMREIFVLVCVQVVVGPIQR